MQCAVFICPVFSCGVYWLRIATALLELGEPKLPAPCSTELASKALMHLIAPAPSPEFKRKTHWVCQVPMQKNKEQDPPKVCDFKDSYEFVCISGRNECNGNVICESPRCSLVMS